jgi:ribosomal protein S18 acetylase RimI-like enzyme
MAPAITHRPHRDAADFTACVAVLQAGLAASPDSGYLHPGDLAWRAFRPHGFPLPEVIEVWEDGARIAGFVLLESESGFSCQLLPHMRGGDLERELLSWAHDATLKWRAHHNLEPLCTIEVFADDAARITILESMGYRAIETGWVDFRRSLDAIAEPALADGWQVRGLREQDIDSRATCQSEAFSPGSRTTPDTWRHMMANAPGYDADLDSVVVTPDGTVAAAALAWADHATRIGVFEPVGTRPSFQRQGLGRACLYRGLRAMRDHGMTTAIVGTNRTNEPAKALYRSVGFEDRNRGFEYEWRPS